MSDDDERELDSEKKRLIERIVPMIVKRMVERAVESGVEKLQEGPENLRNFVGDLKLPKEVLSDIYGQIDDTKVGLYKVVAKEIRDVLEHTQFADEIAKVLTKLSFEIKTEIRFIPNTASTSSSGDEPEGEAGEKKSSERSSTFPKPKVSTEVKMRDRDAPSAEAKRRGGREDT
jgi:hypothetical protein